MRECVVATRSLRRPRHCKAKLTIAQRNALDYELAVIDATPNATELSVCNDYRVMVERLASCRRMSAAARAAFEQAYRDLWKQRDTVRDESVLAARCRAMLESLRQAIAPTCGW
jgi:hypothetical protein